MSRRGALDGVRVLDWTDESGRLAGKLLAEAGADVLRVRRGDPGPHLSGPAGRRGGVLDWWFDAGTRLVSLDPCADGAEAFVELAERADVLVASGSPRELSRVAPGGRALHPELVQVSLTPYGLAGPRADWRASDLVAAALGGVLAVSGTPEAPQNGWGRQCFNVGGFYAAVAALAGLHRARAGAGGVHADLSLVQAVASCTEQVLMYWLHQDWFPGGIAPRQGSLHWTGLYEVMPCADGHVMVAVAPNLRGFFEWMIAEGAAGDLAASPPATAAEAYQRAAEIMAQVRPWASRQPAAEFSAEAQRRNLAFGAVRAMDEALRCTQLAARGFLRDVAWSHGGAPAPSVRVPHPLFRLTGSPHPSPAPPPERAETRDEALAAWPRRAARPRPSPPAGATPATKPLRGLRVLDFTWVLAGPFATRILADLGADVVKIQTEPLSQGANANEFPFFLMWNRGKRGLTLNMRHRRAVDTFRALVARSDVVVENFSPGVLDRWGIGYTAARDWNRGIVYAAMAGCGQDGPWRDYVTYAPTIHALVGLTSLSNPPGRGDVGLGVSLTDHVSGLAAAMAILEALEHRRHSGEGQLIDLSQLEVGAYLVGPAYLQAEDGAPPRAAGNRDAFEDHVPNEVYRCLGGAWIAITARDDAEWHALCRAVGDPALTGDPELATVGGRRAASRRIDDALAAWAATQDAGAAMRRLQAAGVPAGRVQTAHELARDDEQLATRDWLVELPHATLERQVVDRFPATFDGEPVPPQRASPALGEHTFEVCAELLGMDEATVAEAIADGLLA